MILDLKYNKEKDNYWIYLYKNEKEISENEMIKYIGNDANEVKLRINIFITQQFWKLILMNILSKKLKI